MLRGLIALTVVALVAASAAVAAQPRLRLAQMDPLVVAGTRFESRESVRVTLRLGPRTFARTIRASANGSFKVSFGNPDYDRCRDTLSATARGRQGSFVTLKLPHLLCPPPLSP